MKRNLILLSCIFVVSALFLTGGDCGYRYCGEVQNELACTGQSYGGQLCAWDSENSVCMLKPKSCQQSNMCLSLDQVNCGAGSSAGICEWDATSCQMVFDCSQYTSQPTCTAGTNPCVWAQ